MYVNLVGFGSVKKQSIEAGQRFSRGNKIMLTLGSTANMYAVVEKPVERPAEKPAEPKENKPAKPADKKEATKKEPTKKGTTKKETKKKKPETQKEKGKQLAVARK